MCVMVSPHPTAAFHGVALSEIFAFVRMSCDG